ncbi:helix-turn-helix domain-containing protein [Mucilaginibacter aquariorum]|uniref:AraC family transcriptional regulator n=1 Tax=Mucilaginibacter aquariorum TaxID=2967225 RepID=A0ABT1SYZ1_9SPHI|nr:AraC family transcriptional regulator [Mucilaginibacter aquariorum]MCQ6957492.1 AraC family transcriptional regulator [Mucilaginibacter aquariorum]
MLSSISKAVFEKELKDSFSVDYLDKKFESVACRLIYHRMILVQFGKGNLLVDDLSFPISDNQLLLIAKGQIYQFQTGTYITGYEISFGDCFWERAPASASNCKAVLFNNASVNQQLPLNGEDYKELSLLFGMLYTEYLKTDFSNKLDALAAYLKIIMIKVANVNASLARGYDSFENQLYGQFLELISQQYKKSHEVADYARQLGISARKLTELSKRCSGHGAKELINGQLIAEAKRALQFSSQPVKEIAFMLNFSTPEQFSHFFKKNSQVSPQDFRTQFVNIGM